VKANFVPIAVKNASTKLERLVPAALSGPHTLDIYEYLCRCYRQMAIGALLTEGDPQGFYGLLFRSARAFVFFMETAPAGEKLTSKCEPFLDAVACRDDEGARRLAALAPRTPDPGREYEEDFYHLRFLMDRFYGQAEPAALAGMLDAWEQLGGDPPDLRLPLCRALLAGDQAAFDEALAEAIAAKVARFAKLKEDDKLSPDDAATVAKVSIEVLAWVELGERAGLKVASDYKLAPSLARRFHRIEFPSPDAWRVLA
jgi:hypothetical protein